MMLPPCVRPILQMVTRALWLSAGMNCLEASENFRLLPSSMLLTTISNFLPFHQVCDQHQGPNQGCRRLHLALRSEKRLFVREPCRSPAMRATCLGVCLHLYGCRHAPHPPAAVLLLPFLFCGGDPPQEVFNKHESTVFAHVRQGDRTSPFCFTNCMPQEVCALRNDTLLMEPWCAS